jgi:hypothetical protein
LNEIGFVNAILEEFRRKMKENDRESSLSYLSFLQRNLLMKDSGCHAQVFVSLNHFYSNTIIIRPLLVAEAMLQDSSLKNHER